ncbi:MAG: DUF1570 domain-containing protein [Planctomycetota bacterium]
MPFQAKRARTTLLFEIAAALVLSFAGAARGQAPATDDAAAAEPAARPAPNDGPLGLAVPDGVKPSPATVELAEYDGQVVRVLAELDDQRAIKLPTGQITIVPADDTAETTQPFRAADRVAMIASLREDGLTEAKIEPAGYYLFAYDCSEAYYLHTRSILESMLRGVVKQLGEWGLKPQRPETPLVVVIFPSRAAFDAYAKMPEGVAAYYNGVTNRVILYEDDRLFESAPEFALKQGAYVVAHEAIHQLLHNTGIQRRLSAWPMWISEGLPEYFCPLKVHSSLAKTDGDELPVRTVRWTEAGMVNDLRMHDLLRTRGGDGRVIQTVVGAPSLSAHGYSLAWGLTHYLAERKPEEFAAYLADLRQQPALSMLDERPRGPDPLFVKHFGEKWPVVERSVQKHLTSKRMQDAYRDPYVNQTHYVVSVTFKKGRTFYTQASVRLSPAAAREWTSQKRELLDAEGINAHILTRECRTRREAEYHLRKIVN